MQEVMPPHHHQSGSSDSAERENGDYQVETRAIKEKNWGSESEPGAESPHPVDRRGKHTVGITWPTKQVGSLCAAYVASPPPPQHHLWRGCTQEESKEQEPGELTSNTQEVWLR